MGEKPATANLETVAPVADKNKETHSLLSPERELVGIAGSPSPKLQNKKEQSEVGTNSQTQETETPHQSKTTDMETDYQKAQKSDIELKPTLESTFPEVLAHPVIETFTVMPTEIPFQSELSGQAKSSLIEVPLSVVKPLEDPTLDESLEMQQGDAESLDDEQKLCRGFFFKVG